MKKLGLIIFILGVVIVALIHYFWVYQKNDVMLMKQWIELVILEALVLEWSFLMRIMIKKILTKIKF